MASEGVRVAPYTSAAARSTSGPVSRDATSDGGGNDGGGRASIRTAESDILRQGDESERAGGGRTASGDARAARGHVDGLQERAKRASTRAVWRGVSTASGR